MVEFFGTLFATLVEFRRIVDLDCIKECSLPMETKHFIFVTLMFFVNDCLLYFICTTLQAGNVVTHEMVEELLLAGADIIKVPFVLFRIFV